ncbi:MAG: YceI family protein [Verrucomicrobiota bacterium JB023]|nr:YceI family protein [Verrucomicrobiota bacterium JB023]
MKTTIMTMTVGAALLSLTSCKNPADETTDAKVGEVAPEATSAGGTTYVFTDASTIEFTGSKVTGSHDGGFKTFAGSFTVEDDEPIAGTVTIDMNSTYSDSDKLTEHLKSDDFFDVATYPETTFKVTSFEKKSDTTYDVSGNFTLHGVTKNITFPAVAEVSDETISVKADFDINRKDFEIAYAGKPDDLIRDEVVIRLNLEAEPES